MSTCIHFACRGHRVEPKDARRPQLVANQTVGVIRAVEDHVIKGEKLLSKCCSFQRALRQNIGSDVRGDETEFGSDYARLTIAHEALVVANGADAPLQRLGSRIWVSQVVESRRDLRRVSRQPLNKPYEIIL